MAKPLRFTRHARTAMAERELAEEWVVRAVLAPEWEAPDPSPGVVRRFCLLSERGGRILRVACVETPNEIRILSAFLDRRARKPQ